jgi:anti-sigma regulatory factor (Ser/Thr protein kinase)
MADSDHGPGEREAAVHTTDLLACAFEFDTLVSVRHQVERQARGVGLSDIRLYKLVVAVNEIITNAVHHGGGSGHLRLWRDSENLHCEVVDQGPGIPGGRVNGHNRPEPGTIGGWGLWLTREICDEVDVVTDSTGTRVHLQYALREH